MGQRSGQRHGKREVDDAKGSVSGPSTRCQGRADGTFAVAGPVTGTEVSPRNKAPRGAGGKEESASLFLSLSSDSEDDEKEPKRSDGESERRGLEGMGKYVSNKRSIQIHTRKIVTTKVSTKGVVKKRRMVDYKERTLSSLPSRT